MESTVRRAACAQSTQRQSRWTGLGVAVALYYSVDVIPEALSWVNFDVGPTIVGKILTGLAIGQGSEFVHQFYNRLKPTAPAP